MSDSPLSNEPSHRPSSTHSSQPSTASSGQSLIIGIILGLLVLALFALIFFFSNNRSGYSSKNNRELLLSQINAKRHKLGSSSLSQNGFSAEALAQRIDQDASTLSTLLKSIQGDLLSAQSEVTGLRATVTSNSATIQKLQQENIQLRNEAVQLQPLKGQIEAQNNSLISNNKTITKLQSLLSEAPTPAAFADLKQQLEDALNERNSYEEQLRLLKTKGSTMVNAGDLDELQRKNNALLAKNEQLRYTLQNLRAKLDENLFVDSANLAPLAQNLFKKLSNLEGIRNEDRLKRYISMNKDLHASVIDTVQFQTGSSKIAINKIEHLKKTLKNTHPNSFFLVVGYASNTGDLTANRTLSSKRATTVASQVNALKKSDQRVQAVFLGQTNRFSATDPRENQLCEIWEIRQ